MRRIIFVLLLVGVGLHAQTVRTAASADNFDIQAMLDLSSSGDTVIIPAGAVTWTDMAYPTGSTKTMGIGIPAGVTLQGSGVASTVITDETGAPGSSGSAIWILPGTGTEISNFTIQCANTGYAQNLIMGQGGVLDLKIHDMALSNVTVRGLNLAGVNGPHPTGVCWNTTFTARSYPGNPGGGVFQLGTIQGSDFLSYSNPPSQSTQAGSLAYAPGFGTASAFFFEDCTFVQDAQGDSSIETYYGGKVVARYNTGTNFEIGVHGRDSSVRTGHMVECYNNVITVDIGTQWFFLLCRGGTGVYWGNRVTVTSANGGPNVGNALVLQDYRAAGNKHADTGTHTGANGATVLTDATGAWSSGSMVQTGYDINTIYNTTTGASGTITGNTSTTVTAPLTGGSRQTWNAGDTYITVTSRFPYAGNQNDGHNPYDGNQPVTNGTGTHTGSNGDSNLTDATKSWGTLELAGTGDYNLQNTLRSYFIWNMTTGAGAFISGNTATTATTSLAGGDRQTWNTGDVYIITFGYPGLDQNGWAGPTSFSVFGQSSQVLTPWYSWDNTFNGTPDQFPFQVSYTDSTYTSIAQPASTQFIQENREYYNATQKPGYTPYTYPHPLRPVEGSVANITTLNVETLTVGPL